MDRAVQPQSASQGVRSAEAEPSIDAATEAAEEMAAQSAVLVEMMEDLEERLRLRMAKRNDSGVVYRRKVRHLRSFNDAESDSSAAGRGTSPNAAKSASKLKRSDSSQLRLL